MFLARLKKYILLLFLFIFVGNILIVPFSTKAEEAGPPSPNPTKEWRGLNDTLYSTKNYDDPEEPKFPVTSWRQGTDKNTIYHLFSSTLPEQLFGLSTNLVKATYTYAYFIDSSYFVWPGTPLAQSCDQNKCYIYKANFTYNNLFNDDDLINLFWLIVDQNGTVKGVYHAAKETGQQSRSKIYNRTSPYGRNEIESYVRQATTNNWDNGEKVNNFINPGTIDPAPLGPAGTPKECADLYKELKDATTAFTTLNADTTTSEDALKAAREKVDSSLNSVVQKRCDKDAAGAETEEFKNAKKAAEEAVAINRAPVATPLDGLGSEDCGCSKLTGITGITAWFMTSICEAMCALNKAFGAFTEWCFKFLSAASGVSTNYVQNKTHISTLGGGNVLQFVGVAHAADKGIVNDLTKSTTKQPWIFVTWNFCLGLVNVLVIGILIFLAFINILRIQIDTYALKKILPTLILAIIIANFSMLICRMLVDFSDVLTRTVYQAFGISNGGLELGQKLAQALSLANVATGGIMGVGLVLLPFLANPVTLAAFLVLFIVAIIVVLIPAILALILAFLLYIRIAVVYFLAAISPLAFIMIALPSTQGIFKQWWAQFARWVFMAPAVFLLLGAALLPTSGAGKLIPFIITCAMLYLAVQVPFKLGGAVMAAWGGLGKTLGKNILKATDYTIGKGIEKTTGQHLSPFTLYKGWKDGGEQGWQRHAALGGGTAQDLREGTTSLIGNFGKKGAFQAAKDRMNMGSHGKSAEMQGYENDYKAILAGQPSDANLMNLYAKSHSYDEAASLYLANAQRGNPVDPRELYKHDSTYKKTKGKNISTTTSALLNQAESLSAQSGKQVLLTNDWEEGIDGKIQKKTEQAGINDASKNLDRTMSNKPDEQDHQINVNLIPQLQIGNDFIPLEQLNRSQLAILKYFQDNQEKLSVRVPITAQILTRYRIKPKTEIINKSDLSGIVDNELKKNIQDMAGLGGSAVRTQPSYRTVEIAMKLRANEDKVATTMKKSGQRLMQGVNADAQKIINQVTDDFKKPFTAEMKIEVNQKLKEAKINFDEKKLDDLMHHGRTHQNIQEHIDLVTKPQDENIKQMIKEVEKRNTKKS